MDSFNPLVSIIIPVYNGSNYMREAIDSALSQTYTNIEVIIVNDGSNDDGKTERLALGYGDRIRYIYKENGGVSTALNAGISVMKGTYFSWLSHDDVYTPDKVEKEVAALSKIENKDTLILCRSKYIDANSNPVTLKKASESLPENKVLSWDAALMQLVKNGSFNGCAFLISKAVFEQCGNFDETLRFNQDGFMWNKIFLNKYPLYCISDACVLGRIHQEQVTQKRQDLFHKDCEAMSNYLIPKFEQISTENQNFLYEYIKYNAKYSNISIVKKALISADNLNLINALQKMIVFVFVVYGKARPMIRQVYYGVKCHFRVK